MVRNLTPFYPQMARMRSQPIIPPLRRPPSGVGRHRVYFLTFDADLLADPVDIEIQAAASDGGIAAPRMTRQSEGVYFSEYLCPAADAHDAVSFTFSWQMGRAAMTDSITKSIEATFEH